MRKSNTLRVSSPTAKQSRSAQISNLVYRRGASTNAQFHVGFSRFSALTSSISTPSYTTASSLTSASRSTNVFATLSAVDENFRNIASPPPSAVSRFPASSLVADVDAIAAPPTAISVVVPSFARAAPAHAVIGASRGSVHRRVARPVLASHRTHRSTLDAYSPHARTTRATSTRVSTPRVVAT